MLTCLVLTAWHEVPAAQSMPRGESQEFATQAVSLNVWHPRMQFVFD